MKSSKIYSLTVSKKQMSIIKKSIKLYVALATKEYGDIVKYIQQTPAIFNLDIDKNIKTRKLTEEDGKVIQHNILYLELDGTNYKLSQQDKIKEFREQKLANELKPITKDLPKPSYDKENTKQYTYILNEITLKLIQFSLETFSRVGTKQYQIAFSTAYYPIISPDKYDKRWFGFNEFRIIERIIRQFEQFFISEPNAAWGIYSRAISNDFRIAWDLVQVIRYNISWANAEDSSNERDKNFSKYMGINFDSPMNSSKEPLAKCTVIE